MIRQAEQPRVSRPDATPVTGSGGLRLSPVPLEWFDEYVVVARLGTGGMAEVFLGLSRGPNDFRKLFAIKRLHRHLHDDPDAVLMFLKEATLAARLQHANVVQTLKVGTFDGQHFLAMEYLDGQPLNRVLSRLRTQDVPLSPALAARIVSDALDGLDYAHEARDFDGRLLQIVHRDVSPHNLFVTFDGQVKLLDFGIAKVRAVESHTRAGLIKGKLAYIAPEQARGEPLDRRADLWGMGVTLWESLTGERLFRGGNDVSMLRATLKDEIPWVSEVAPYVPEELARVVDRALQRDPERRYATALEFKTELDEWLATQTAASSRATLSATMKAVFSDTIQQRREVLCTCLARVDAMPAPHAMQLVRTHPLEQANELVVTAPPAPGARKSRRSRRKIALVASVVVTALLLAVAVGRGASLLAEAPMEPAKVAVSPKASLPETSLPRAGEAPPSHYDERLGAPSAPAHEVVATAPVRATLHSAEPTSTAPAEELRAPEPTSSAKGAGSHRRTKTNDSSAPQTVAPREVSAASEPVPASSNAQPTRAGAGVTAESRGRLALDSTPYAVVTLEGRRLGITPIDVELPAGTHVLTLKNPEQGITTTYRVVIPPGDSVQRRVALD